MPGIRHFYFLESIGCGDWFYGTTLQDIRYAVEGWGSLFGEALADDALPEEVVFHYPCCYGGDVVEGYGIYNYIRGLAAKGVKTRSVVSGLCASIACLTALAADTVEMSEVALWMVHKPTVDSWGDADEHASAATLLNKIQQQVATAYVNRSGGKLDLATAHELMNQTSWLTADECLSYGFITGKLADAPLEVPTGTEKVLNYFPKNATKPAATMAISTAEKKGIVDEVVTAMKNLFGTTPPKPKNEEAAPVVVPVVVPTVANASEAVTDNDPLYFDGVLAIDTAVYSDEAMTTAYADGDYTLADGRTLTVAAGLVTALADAAEDNAATNVAAAPDEALVAENTALKADNALLQRQLTAAKNKLRATVPGSTGAPTAPGSVQNVVPKTTPAKNAAGSMFSLTPPSTSNRK